MRLPYTQDPNTSTGTTTSEEHDQILRRILVRRGSMGLIALDRTLLHAPQVADAWHTFAEAINARNSLPTKIKKLAILRVASLNQCTYAWKGHSDSAKEAGLGEEVLEQLLDRSKESWLDSDSQPLDDRSRAVLRYTDAITRNSRASDETFDHVRAFFNDKEIVELTALISGYNMVTRFVNALDVGEMSEVASQVIL